MIPALVLRNGLLEQATTGSGLRPWVLMPDGTVRIRQTTEGTPVVYDSNGGLRTLAPGETLII